MPNKPTLPALARLLVTAFCLAAVLSACGGKGKDRDAGGQGATNDAPDAVADQFATAGNTQLSVAADGVLANDNDADGDVISIVDPGSPIATTLSGTAVVDADGALTYTPPIGVTGVSDSFSYEITDGTASSFGTVSIDLVNRVWYVDNQAAAPGSGLSNAPFDTLATAEAASAPDDIIFIFAGDGSSTGMDQGITLKDGQQLIGNGVNLEIDLGAGAVTLVTAAVNPVITNGSGIAVDLAENNVVAGLTIHEPLGIGIEGQPISSVTIRNVTINADSNTAIAISNDDPAGPVAYGISDTTIDGTGTLGIARTGISIAFGLIGGSAALDLDLAGNTIGQVDDAVLLNLEGTTGTGLDGPSQVTIDNNQISDFTGAGLDLRTDGASISDIFILNNTIDGGAPANLSAQAGIEVLVGQNDAGGVTDLTIDGNTVLDSGAECILLSGGNEAGNAGTLNALLNLNSLTGCGDHGLRVRADDAATYNVSATNNTLSGNGIATTFEFTSNTAAIMRVRLEINDDSLGFVLDCDATGVLSFAAPNNQGSAMDCTLDDAVFAGHLVDTGNQTGGGNPVGNLTGAGNTIDIIDATAVTQPQ